MIEGAKVDFRDSLVNEIDLFRIFLTFEQMIFADRFIEDKRAIKEFVTYLFASFSHKPFSSAFVPTSKVE